MENGTEEIKNDLIVRCIFRKKNREIYMHYIKYIPYIMLIISYLKYLLTIRNNIYLFYFQNQNYSIQIVFTYNYIILLPPA